MPLEDTKLYLKFIHLLTEGGTYVLCAFFLKKLTFKGNDFSHLSSCRILYCSFDLTTLSQLKLLKSMPHDLSFLRKH